MHDKHCYLEHMAWDKRHNHRTGACWVPREVKDARKHYHNTIYHHKHYMVPVTLVLYLVLILNDNHTTSFYTRRWTRC